ncbi:sensor domain-containing diguanylate cyclase [Nitrincola tibetensis]|uniref:Sensor domain-containing diguanylate cyclase n=1 Tax=Nitrincola tibetensis TaxID=2219697 RepID=A0A364NKT6_9GAMM|nr:diguanylate cyclase [Nitrincola tibetensis]RAU17485.1 sensor domain-containing diguanylate cyclase [Nitrincola tibetensis]
MFKAKRKGVLSLRSVLTIPYVVLVVCLALSIGGLSYQAGSKAINTLIDQLLLETVGRITQAIDRHIIGSGAVLETAFPIGMPAPIRIESDMTNLKTRFWIATSLHTDPNDYVYYGNEAGQGIGLQRLSDNKVELRLKLEASEHRKIYHYEGIDGELQLVREEDRLFDPRVRPWYVDGKELRGHTWTSIYIDFGSRQLIATRARQVLSQEGFFEGVVATDVSLRALNEFVGHLRISPQGIAFIVEPNGKLIAASNTPNVLPSGNGEFVRVAVEDVSVPIMADVYKAVISSIEEQGVPDETRPLSLVFDDQLIHVAFDRVRDDAGLDWLSIVAVPDSDFMSGITENIKRSVYIAVVAIIIAILIGLAILNWVAADLRKLKEALVRVGDGELDAPVNIYRRDELGELARGVEQMQKRLQTDPLTGLINRDAFTLRLRKLIEGDQHYRRQQSMAVLFIDINRFKHINNAWGRDAGDLALKEIAARISNVIDSDDCLARFSGDEFVILLRSAERPDRVKRVMEQINQVLAEPLECLKMDPWLSLTAAMGVSYYPTDSIDADGLVRLADYAMYREKESTPMHSS